MTSLSRQSRTFGSSGYPSWPRASSFSVLRFERHRQRVLLHIQHGYHLIRGPENIPGTSGIDEFEGSADGMGVESTTRRSFSDISRQRTEVVDAVGQSLQQHTDPTIAKIPPFTLSGFGQNHRRHAGDYHEGARMRDPLKKGLKRGWR